VCGIGGIISKQDQKRTAEACKNLLSHRGPDHTGLSNLRLADYHVHITHNRLSILDLSDQAHQPFWHPSGDYCLIFNGEIYNYLEIREELRKKGYAFTTTSDTEVLMMALIVWPVEEALNKLNGMWAFSFFDLKNQKILFSRDRFGKKPFYYHVDGNQLIWASEIKYILAASKNKFAPNKAVVAQYLKQFLLESESSQTFFKDISKLPAGTYAWVDLNKSAIELKPQKFYHFPQKTYPGALLQAEEELEHLLEDAVKIRLRSDVNVGFLLSGGLDSSLLSSFGNKLSHSNQSNLKYLSITSEDPKYDESPFINLVENHLGISSKKVELKEKAKEAFDLLGQVIWQNDEPITTLAAVTYYLMMKTAKEMDTKVLITGQGADEIFCGYRKYLGFYLQSLMRQGNLLKSGEVLFQFLKTQSLIKDIELSELKRYVSFLNKGSLEILTPELGQYHQPSITLQDQTLNERQIADLFQFSVPALLHYEDRLSMAFGREVRAPFLDYRIAELGVSLPSSYKINQGWSKFILRKIAKKYLPREVAYRKDKKGFTIPQERWLKTELKHELEALFKSDCLIYQFNFVDKEVLLKKYELFCQEKPGAARISYKEIFAPLALEAWLRRFNDYLHN
jgi:asparagine synthase (glutamine-hydrolysing)